MKKFFMKAMSIAQSVSQSVSEDIKKVYDALVQFCYRIGGNYVFPDSPDKLALYGEFECNVPRRMDNKRIAEIVAKDIPNEVLPKLQSIDSVLPPSFKIKEYEKDKLVRSTTVYGNGSLIFGIQEVKTFDIDPEKVEYVYPDHVEDFARSPLYEVSISAKGYKDRKYKAWAMGTIRFKYYLPFPNAEKHIENALNEADTMVKELFENPKNFFKFKGE